MTLCRPTSLQLATRISRRPCARSPSKSAATRMAGYGDNDLVGVEYGTQCFCGHGFAVKQPQSSDKCSMKCAGNSSDTCGGSYAIEVFKASCTMPPSELDAALVV